MIISEKESKLIIIMGSASDLSFVDKMRKFLNRNNFKLKFELFIASAHKVPEFLIEKVKKIEKSKSDIVYITVAGLSDALSGMVSGLTKRPIIACSPDGENKGWSKIYSSIMTPIGIPVLFTIKPENAVLAAIRILAISNNSLYEELERYIEKMKKNVINSNDDVK